MLHRETDSEKKQQKQHFFFSLKKLGRMGQSPPFRGEGGENVEEECSRGTGRREGPAVRM